MVPLTPFRSGPSTFALATTTSFLDCFISRSNYVALLNSGVALRRVVVSFGLGIIGQLRNDTSQPTLTSGALTDLSGFVRRTGCRHDEFKGDKSAEAGS